MHLKLEMEELEASAVSSNFTKANLDNHPGTDSQNGSRDPARPGEFNSQVDLRQGRNGPRKRKKCTVQVKIPFQVEMVRGDVPNARPSSGGQDADCRMNGVLSGEPSTDAVSEQEQAGTTGKGPRLCTGAMKSQYPLGVREPEVHWTRS